MKKFLTMAASAALLAAAVIPAIAAGNGCGNATTGPLSTNYCTINNTSDVKVNNVNDAQIENRVNTVSNTGNNSASYNTLGGSISTGNATMNVTLSNVANVNTVSISGGAAAGGNLGMNSITGPSSYNQAAINNERKVDVYNSNTASVLNDVNAVANAGDNRADYNTGPAVVRAGNAALNVGVSTHVNDSATAISAGAGSTGNNTVGNDTTGPFSTNYSTIDNGSRVKVDNVNDMIVGNFVDTLAQTGDNSASYNTLGGDIRSGNAGVGVGVGTVGNINTTSVEQAMGAFSNNASNGVTGPMSLNQTAVENGQNVDVENWNNKCKSHNADRLDSIDKLFGDVGNFLTGSYDQNHRDHCDVEDLGVFNYNNDVANAGSNLADYNTGPAEVATGWTSLLKDLSTRMNDTLVVIK
jgi:hypothetical protein